MDGYQATARLRADARFITLPIIAMTAHATIEERQRCLAAGMNDHVAKPIDPAVLFETVGRFFKSSGATSPVAQETSTEGGLPQVEGLDSADGLLRLGGNRKLYLKLLRQFLREKADGAAQISERLDAGDHETAERIAHTIKGVAGNLGAKPVQAVAGELENAMRAGADRAQLETLRERLAERLSSLATALRPLLTEEAPAAAIAVPDFDPVKVKPVAEKMFQQLSEFDAAVSDEFEAHRALFASLFPAAELDQFEQHLQNYAFGEAQALLEKAAAARGLEIHP
jgi:two-component system sensor histidine kinase/response regulator